MTGSNRWLKLKTGCLDSVGFHQDYVSQLVLNTSMVAADTADPGSAFTGG